MQDKIEYIIKIQDQISAQLKTIQANTDNMNSSIDKSSSFLKNFSIAAGAAFVANKVIEYGGAVLELGAKFEAAEIGLGTLLKSTEAGHKAFEQIKKDAQATPFDTDSLLMANKALIGAGASADEARKVVMDLGNAIAATGGGSDELGRMAVNLQQIKNVGKATAVDIKQFAFAGINIYELLAKATGKNKEEVKDMEISYEDLSKALAMAHEKGGLYEGGLEKMSKSTQVQMSNIKDTITFMGVDLFNTLKPVIDVALQGAGDFLAKIKEIMPIAIDTIKPFIQVIWNAIQTIIKPIVSIIKPALMNLRDAFQSITSAIQAIYPSIEPVLSVIGKILATVILVASWIIKIIAKITEWIFKMPLIQKIFEFIAKIIGWVWDKIEGILGFIKKALEYVGLLDKDKSSTSTNAKSAFNSETLTGAASAAAGAANTALTPTKDIKASTPESAKLTNINITMDSLVKDFRIVTQKLDMSEQQAKQFVVKTLLGAVNGFNVIAGQ